LAQAAHIFTLTGRDQVGHPLGAEFEAAAGLIHQLQPTLDVGAAPVRARQPVVVVLLLLAGWFHPAIKMLGLTPHKGRAQFHLDGEHATVVETPLQHRAHLGIDGVVAGLALNVVLKAAALDRDQRQHAELARSHPAGLAIAAMAQGRWAGEQQEPCQA
jgi:hypothetical protein